MFRAPPEENQGLRPNMQPLSVPPQGYHLCIGTSPMALVSGAALGTFSEATQRIGRCGSLQPAPPRVCQRWIPSTPSVPVLILSPPYVYCRWSIIYGTGGYRE